MPFDGIVSNNPKVEEMRQVVSVEKKRPAIPSKWHSDEVLIVHMFMSTCDAFMLHSLCCGLINGDSFVIKPE